MHSNISFLFKGGPDHPSGRVLPGSKASLGGLPHRPWSSFPQPSALHLPAGAPPPAELQPCGWGPQLTGSAWLQGSLRERSQKLWAGSNLAGPTWAQTSPWSELERSVTDNYFYNCPRKTFGGYITDIQIPGRLNPSASISCGRIVDYRNCTYCS